MSTTLPFAEAERDLRGALQALRPGEVITLVDETGASVGKLSAAEERSADWQPRHDWTRAMDQLAEEVSALCQGEKSALEELRDQRNARRFEDAP